jgi:hypothetical protein
MSIYNRYVVSVAILLLITTVLLVATGQSSLDVYYSLYVVEALIVTELFVYFNKRSRRALHSVSICLFLGFLTVLAIQVFKALALI